MILLPSLSYSYSARGVAIEMEDSGVPTLYRDARRFNGVCGGSPVPSPSHVSVDIVDEADDRSDPLRCSFRILFVLVPFGAVTPRSRSGSATIPEQGVVVIRSTFSVEVPKSSYLKHCVFVVPASGYWS